MEKKKEITFFMGILAALVVVLPGLLLGENAVFTYHDQLDGEVIAYLLQARHLFSGDILPEFMNGASKTALTMPAPGCVLFFLTGNALFGLTAMLIMGKVIGYVGMYLLVAEVAENRVAAMVTGVLFSWLPFLPVYGLSQFGIPLLFWCAIQIRKGKYRLQAYLYAAFFALTSSLALVGFGILGMGILWLLWCWRKHREAVLRSFAAWLLLLGIYISENFRLLAELLGGAGDFVSHKTEYSLTAAPFWGQLVSYLTRGGQHSEDYHWLPLLCALLILSLCFVRKTAGTRKLAGVMGVCLGWNVLFAVVAAFWDSAAGIWLRQNLSVFGAFQLDRLLWIAPCFWYLLLACGLALGGQLIKTVPRGVSAAAALGMSAAILCLGMQILLAGDVKNNVQKLRNPDYGILSFREYYATDVMCQVEDYLRETAGQEPEDYRVVSLGIDPAAALYQGFYCLDGYSNYYSLAYKKSFRRILQPELERSDYLREYFDNWGNRCYLFSSECPVYYTIEKNGFFFQDYRIDTQALSELGGTYLFSAAYIVNAEEQGLKLLREEPFETEESYYRIFIYTPEILYTEAVADTAER